MHILAHEFNSFVKESQWLVPNTELNCAAVIIENQLSLGKKKIDGLIKVQHFYDVSVDTNSLRQSIKLTAIATDLIGRTERRKKFYATNNRSKIAVPWKPTS